MPEVSEAVTVGGAYKESDDFVPDPTDAYGTLDTSGTAGAAHGKVEAVTPIFEVAKAQDAITAAKALDPDDDSVHSSLVVLPQGMVVSESGEQEARDRVTQVGQKAASEPVEVGGPNPFQKAAAESGDEAKAEADAQSPSGQGGGLDGSAGGTHTAEDDADQKAAAEKEAADKAAADKAEADKKAAAKSGGKNS